jgi:hypothetical protein
MEVCALERRKKALVLSNIVFYTYKDNPGAAF